MPRTLFTSLSTLILLACLFSAGGCVSDLKAKADLAKLREAATRMKSLEHPYRVRSGKVCLSLAVAHLPFEKRCGTPLQTD